MIKSQCSGFEVVSRLSLRPGRYTSPSKEAGLVIYFAFLAKVANLYYMILTAFKKYWPDAVAKFISGTQAETLGETYILSFS